MSPKHEAVSSYILQMKKTRHRKAKCSPEIMQLVSNRGGLCILISRAPKPREFKKLINRRQARHRVFIFHEKT